MTITVPAKIKDGKIYPSRKLDIEGDVILRIEKDPIGEMRGLFKMEEKDIDELVEDEDWMS